MNKKLIEYQELLMRLKFAQEKNNELLEETLLSQLDQLWLSMNKDEKELSNQAGQSVNKAFDNIKINL